MSDTSDLPGRYHEAFTDDPVENTQDLPEPERTTRIPSNAEETTGDPSHGAPLAHNDNGVTAPPPPYWSISPTNDIIQGPSIGNNESENSQSLCTAPPPAYHTLYGDVETTEPEAQVEVNITDPEPSQDQAATNQHPVPPQETDVENNSQPAQDENTKGKVFLYFLAMGVALPVFMIIVGKTSKCPASESLPDISVAGGAIQMIYGFTTFCRGEIWPKGKSCDPLIVGIAIWSFFALSNVSGVKDVDNCDALLYYFMFSVAVLYVVFFGMVALYFISVIIYPQIKGIFKRENQR